MTNKTKTRGRDKIRTQNIMKKYSIVLLLTMVTLTSCSKDDEILPQGDVTTTLSKRTTSVQCTAITQSGSRCKNNTLSWNSKCHIHGGN